MIPYVHVPRLWLDCISVDAQVILTILGLIIAVVIAHLRTRRLLVDGRDLNSFISWLLVGTVIGGHASDVLCYRWAETVGSGEGQTFWRVLGELLLFWDGWRSVGGFFGAFFGALLWRAYVFRTIDWLRLSEFTRVQGYWFVARERSVPILRLADLTLSVFPVAWFFNRAGSALIHDHPGRRAATHSLFAVAFPDSTVSIPTGMGIVQGTVPRYDLGLLELGVTLALVFTVVFLWARPLKSGTYVCLAGLTYPPARFALDFLRRRTGPVVEPSFGSLTPAQWGFAALSAMSAVMLLWVWARPADRSVVA